MSHTLNVLRLRGDMYHILMHQNNLIIGAKWGSLMSVLVILIVGIVLILMFSLWKFVYSKVLNDMPFEKKRFFFTAKQRSFYQVLQQATGDKYIIFARVSMAEVIRTSHGLSTNKRAAYVQKLQGVQVPFVLCEANSLAIVAGVMLDEQAQQDKQSLTEHHFIMEVFKVIGLPLVCLKTTNTYDVKLLEQRLFQQIGEPQPVPTQDFLSEAGEDTNEPVVELVLKPMGESSEDVPSKEQVCPKCGAPMVLKKAEKGRRAGKPFLMCSTFPECKRAIPVESYEAGDMNQPAMMG